MSSRLATGRHAGLMVPLFSFPSRHSWGLGEIGDLEPMAAWLRSAGQDLLQLLPLNEMAPGQQSPYSAISAMAIDPLFISMAGVVDFAAIGGEATLPDDARLMLHEVRHASVLDYGRIRALKDRALRTAFARFLAEEWRRHSARADALRTFLAEQAWWLEDYAVFRALHADAGEQSWLAWPERLRRHDPAAIFEARTRLADEILYRQYLQWIADDQWRAARRAADPVALMGDLPFVVDVDSADVWARQEEFRLDVSVGVPPDAFSDEGQDWGLPLYRWDVLARLDFRWLRERARRNAQIYAGFRIDHLVGFYRTYARPHDGSAPFFSPGEERAQTKLGETLVGIFRESGAHVVAEDLGLVPDFVRASLARMGVPGYRVLRWEREWKAPGQPFRDPAHYPTASLATSGTHDTDTMAVWWEHAGVDERRAVADLPLVRQALGSADVSAMPYTETVRDALLEALFASGSDLLVLPIPDVFGWRDRINQPGTIDGANWTYRLPWLCDELDRHPEAIACRDRLRMWSARYQRSRSGLR